jgi:hypothetical protein
MNALSEMPEVPQCATEQCEENGVVALSGRAHCLEHFFQGCYVRLEGLDPVVRGKSRESAIQDGAPKVLEEVVKQVLIVCLQHEKLSNLDRSRLLDILLWAGELQFLLRVPRSISPEEIVYGGRRRALAGRSLAGN